MLFIGCWLDSIVKVLQLNGCELFFIFRILFLRFFAAFCSISTWCRLYNNKRLAEYANSLKSILKTEMENKCHIKNIANQTDTA